jgi:uncharacterized protein
MNLRILVLTLMLVGGLTACVGGPVQATRLYQLSARSVTGTAQLPLNIGLGPLKWPEYLDRRQIIVRQDASRLEPLDNERWAEALDTGFERVLRENLIRSAHPQRLQSFPWVLTDAPAISVPLEVFQFDTDAHGATVLRARWRVITRERKELVAERDSAITLQAADTSPAGAVAAQSEAVARLATEITRALQALPPLTP